MVYTVSDVNVTVPQRVQVVMIVDGIYEIPSKYFAKCCELKHVILPDSIKIIGNFTFDNRRKLEMITLPSNLYSIGKGCFRNCVKLKMMFLPSNLHYVYTMYKIGACQFTSTSYMYTIFCILSMFLTKINYHSK